MEQALADVRRDESEYLDAVDELQPAATQEIADAVGVTRQGADYRLRQLREEGKVDGALIGNSLVWTLDGE